MNLWTIGHSTRPLDEFLDALAAHAIECVADVRRFPGSRRLPQYGQAALQPALTRCGIDYVWLPALGGRRRPAPDSPNLGWRHPAFRAYADHMATPEWHAGLQELLTVAHGLRTAVMCSEVLWWRCHRRLIADALVLQKWSVVHIRDARNAEPHRLRAPARPLRGVLRYPAARAGAKT